MLSIVGESGTNEKPSGSKTWEYLASLTCTIFAFGMGTTIGWVSPSSVKLLEPDSPVPFTPEDISTMVAAGAVGQLLAPSISNILVDRIGRKNTLLISGLPAVASSVLIILATHVWVIHSARLLAGFSMGTCLCVSPMYMGEIASTKTRGAASSVISVMCNLGILFAYGICPYLSISVVAGIQMIITLAFEVTFWFMPKSPYYLTLIGRPDEAEVVLAQLRGKGNVDDELDIIKNSMPVSNNPKQEKPKSGGLKDLFTGQANRRAYSIAFSFLIAQHFGGYFIVVLFSEMIFKDAGTIIPSHLATLSIGVTQLLSAVMAGVLVDRLGRKPLIMSAGAVAGLANLAMGSYLFVKEYTSYKVDDYSAFFLVAVIVQVFSFNCGLLSTDNVIISEIFATEVKSIGMCLNGTFGGLFTILTSKLYIALAITLALGHSIPFLGCSIIVWGFTIILLRITPETKGKTFVQIQQELNR